MSDTIDQIARLTLAGHLLQCGLDGSASPRGNPGYRQAIALWESSTVFRAEVAAVAAGLGLRVAEVNDRGAALSPTEDSIFAPSFGDIHHLYAGGSTSRGLKQTTAEARAIFAAVLTVTVAMAYPDEHAIDGMTLPGPVSAREVRDKLIALAEREAAEPREEQTEAEVRLGLLWAAVLRCAGITTNNGKHREGSLGWHVKKVFEILAASGHADLRKPAAEGSENADLGMHILPKDRLRKSVRHSAGDVHAMIRAAFTRHEAVTMAAAPHDEA